MRELSLRERARVWDAINRYAQACGGDTGPTTVSTERMHSVAFVESELREVLNNRRESGCECHQEAGDSPCDVHGREPLE